MKARSEFIAYLLELFEPLGPVEAKAMFGGYGIYLDDVIFAIVVDDTLYLKADEKNRGDFEALGLEPFTFRMRGRAITTSYYQAPDQAMDDARCMKQWARQSHAAAMRAVQRRRKPKRTRR